MRVRFPLAAFLINHMKRSDAESEIYNLTQKLIQLKADMKATVGGFRDEIKAIEKEIKDIVESVNDNN